MLQFQAIGNLGADAKVVNENGKQFVSFNVGHNDRWRGQDGVEHESTTWISCALNGDGGRLLPFLKKGRLVFVEGKGSARVYSSEKARGMVAGLNIMVDRLELVGGAPDEVPRQLFDNDGVVHQVTRFFWTDRKACLHEGADDGRALELHAADGGIFFVDPQGFINQANANYKP